MAPPPFLRPAAGKQLTDRQNGMRIAMMKITDAIATALCTLLRPLVRMLLRHNIPFPTFVELAKWVYTDVATRECQLPGKKQTVSRVALLTGLTRKEVLRLHRQSSPIDQQVLERHHRATRVISGWVSGSPKRQLYSKTLALPRLSISRPA